MSSAVSSDAAATAAEDSSEEQEEEEEGILDLGDSSAEDDARKDFAGVIRQSKDYTCGPASLATLFTQLGDDTSEADVLQFVTPDQEKGVTLLSLKIAAEKLNAKVVLKKWTAEQILAYVRETQDPVLIHDEKKGVGGHFSVIRDFDAEKGVVELSDTEAGNIKYSVEDFKHIFTGESLVIAEDLKSPLLAETSTHLSDEEAALVWGKYVPVYVLAEQSGNAKAQADARAFTNCIASAMKIVEKTARNAARTVCYATLGTTLRSDLSFAQEGILGDTFDRAAADSNNKEHGQAVGTSEILGALNAILASQKKIAENAQKIAAFQQAAGKSTLAQLPSLQSQLTKLSSSLAIARTNLSVLTSALSTKQSVVAGLDKEISSGTFSQNGQTFQLGAVGSQVTAKAATYQKLSAGLSAKLANIDGQITNKQNQIASAERAKAAAEKNRSSYLSQANSWQNQANALKAKKKSSTYEQSQASSYTNLANAQQTAINNAVKQISTLNTDIANLKSQKAAAQKEVDTASADKAKLERLKAFGDQELARKKGLLAQMKADVVSLQKQLQTHSATVTSLTSQVTGLQTVITALVSQDGLEKQIAAEKNAITKLKNRYGFATITFENPVETERLKREEVDFAYAQDKKTEAAAVNLLAKSLVGSVTGPTLLAEDIVVSIKETGQLCLAGGQGSGLDRSQSCLDSCGTVDITGPVAMFCDGANGVIYLTRGQYGMAGGSAVALIPFVGTLLKKGGQTVIKGATEETLETVVKKSEKELLEKLGKGAGSNAKGKITVELSRLQHVLEEHAFDGSKTIGNSIFSKGENIVQLIQNSEATTPTKQVGGNFQRIVNAGRIIGIDRVSAQATSFYTVITNALGNLVTAFPGLPPLK